MIDKRKALASLNREVLQQARSALELAHTFIRDGVEFDRIKDTTAPDWRMVLRDTRAALDALGTCVARPLDPVLDQHGCIVLHNGRAVVYRDEVAFHDPVADLEREESDRIERRQATLAGEEEYQSWSPAG